MPFCATEDRFIPPLLDPKHIFAVSQFVSNEKRQDSVFKISLCDLCSKEGFRSRNKQVISIY